jgi:hypothetical protein
VLFDLTLDIFLSRVKTNFVSLRQAILSVDETVVTPQLVKQLLKFAPTSEEIGLLAAFKTSPPENLARPDRFLLEMMQIERFEQRLKAIDFKQTYDERMRDLKHVSITLLVLLTLGCGFGASGVFDTRVFNVFQGDPRHHPRPGKRHEWQQLPWRCIWHSYSQHQQGYF